MGMHVLCTVLSRGGWQYRSGWGLSGWCEGPERETSAETRGNPERPAAVGSRDAQNSPPAPGGSSWIQAKPLLAAVPARPVSSGEATCRATTMLNPQRSRGRHAHSLSRPHPQRSPLFLPAAIDWAHRDECASLDENWRSSRRGDARWCSHSRRHIGAAGVGS